MLDSIVSWNTDMGILHRSSFVLQRARELVGESSEMVISLLSHQPLSQQVWKLSNERQIHLPDRNRKPVAAEVPLDPSIKAAN